MDSKFVFVKCKIRALLSVFILISAVYSWGQAIPKKGYWAGELSLVDSVALPFSLFFDAKNKNLIVHNGEEEIVLEYSEFSGDSSVFNFSSFNSSLIFKNAGKKIISGYFYNKDRMTKGKIPFHAKFSRKNLKFKKTTTAQDISGRWKTSFSAFKKDEYPAIGVFQQNDRGRVSGTFLTETGDYRYLAGEMTGNHLTLSCFDGSHAFLFIAQLINNNFAGTFYSGSHWKTNWIAQRNGEFQLTDPNELTYLKQESEIKFSKPLPSGQSYTYPNQELKGKVVIIQLIGTWCPNCLDETNYFTEVYSDYHDEGLEIIAIGYEIQDNFSDQANRIINYVAKKKIPYPVLVGGIASKELAAKDFNMLNNISSFPTTIFINRQGAVVRIHTGFNGPGTGEIYRDYVTETNKFIERLLVE